MSRPDAPFDPLARPSALSETLAAQLLQRIRSAGLAPGDSLPSEKTLGEQFGVSRAVVREAISRLKAEGYVLTRQGAGAFVTMPGERSFRFAPTPETGDAEVFELRALIESGAAELAALRREASDLDALSAALAAMEAALQGEGDGAAADDAFHAAVAQATHNRQVQAFLQFVAQQFSASRSPTWSAEGMASGRARIAQQEHHALFAAIRTRDAGAARREALAHLAGAAARLGLRFKNWSEFESHD